PELVPGIEVEAVDTNGAGDAHTGVLCADLAAGRPLMEAVRRANVAAGIAVTRRGPATSPTAAEIDARLAQDS
ncbi:MAG: PfkB family carbohydrate kinase, partial [Actinomycetaceae bacterium]